MERGSELGGTVTTHSVRNKSTSSGLVEHEMR